MVKTIDDLKNDYSQVKEDLKSLKTSTISNKDKQADILQKDAEKIEKDIQAEINRLKDSTDATDLAKADEAETFLNDTKKEIDDLYNEITWTVAPVSPTTPTTPSVAPTSGGNIFNKSWSWIKDQWWDIWDKSKRKWEAGTNILRTVWFAATWVWTAALVYKWIKKLFWWWKKKKSKSWEASEDELLKESASRLFKHLSDDEKKSK